jgi:hypothetical protein
VRPSQARATEDTGWRWPAAVARNRRRLFDFELLAPPVVFRPEPLELDAVKVGQDDHRRRNRLAIFAALYAAGFVVSRDLEFAAHRDLQVCLREQRHPFLARA